MMMNLMTILVKKVFISSKPTFVYLLCPPLCGPFSIQESAAGGLSYKAKKDQTSLPGLLTHTFKTTYRTPSLPLHQPTRPSWISPRPISNSQLHALLHFHLCPIYLVVFKGSYFLTNGISHLEGGFTLRCLQRLSLPDLATRP